jgi:hypothetical protein
MNFKVGDEIICIEEKNLPQFIGTRWVIKEVLGSLYLCEPISPILNINMSALDDLYPFKESEVVESTPLLRELI